MGIAYNIYLYMDLFLDENYDSFQLLTFQPAHSKS